MIWPFNWAYLNPLNQRGSKSLIWTRGRIYRCTRGTKWTKVTHFRHIATQRISQRTKIVFEVHGCSSQSCFKTWLECIYLNFTNSAMKSMKVHWPQLYPWWPSVWHCWSGSNCVKIGQMWSLVAFSIWMWKPFRNGLSPQSFISMIISIVFQGK